MKRLILFGMLLIAPRLWAQAPVLNVSGSVAVNQGATFQFLCTANCAGGTGFAVTGTDGSGNSNSGLGSITSGGLYTAPATVTAQQTEGGFQLFPNNHVFNTRIDSLPVNANNATWLALVNTGGTPYQSDTWVGFPINYVNNSSPTDTMSFYYTSANNGSYIVPQFPIARLENGWFNARYGNPFNSDHHLLSFNTATGALSDFYQYYPSVTSTAASVTGNVATLTVPLDTTKMIFTSGESVCVGSFSGADTYFNVCPVTLTAVTPTTISYALTHANASASTNGSVSANTQTGGCSTAGACNSQSSGGLYHYSDYGLPANGATDAAGMYLQPLILRMQEVERAVATGGTVNHAIRYTYNGVKLCSCSIWPATAFANDGGTIPFGARMRLKSSFNISGYSAIAQVLLKQAQQQGFIVADGGINWDTSGEANAWPASYVAAMKEVNNAGISYTITNTAITSNVVTFTGTNAFAVGNTFVVTGTTNCGGALNFNNYIVASATGSQFTANFTHADCTSAADTGTALNRISNFMEFVDESGMMVSSTSGLTTHNREIVSYNSSGGTTSVDVALQGVAVNFPKDYLYIMAGTPSQQLPVFVNIGGVTWSMSPSVGTLSSNGVYTAPATLVSTTTTTISATSSTNSSVAAQLNVVVYPNTAIRIIPSQNADFTDSFGNVWTGGFTGSNQPGTRGSSSCNSPPPVTDHQLWDCQIGYSSENPPETRASFLVPNGAYQITYRYGTQVAGGTNTNKISSQGSVIYASDFGSDAGGQNKLFTEVTTNAVVTDNNLNFIVWLATGGGAPLSSLSIIPGAQAAAVGHLP